MFGAKRAKKIKSNSAGSAGLFSQAKSTEGGDEFQGAAVKIIFQNILFKMKKGVCLLAGTPFFLNISYWFSWSLANGRIGMQILRLK